MPVMRSQGVLAPDGRIFGVPYGAAQVQCCFRMGAKGLGLGSSIYIYIFLLEEYQRCPTNFININRFEKKVSWQVFKL